MPHCVDCLNKNKPNLIKHYKWRRQRTVRDKKTNPRIRQIDQHKVK